MKYILTSIVILIVSQGFAETDLRGPDQVVDRNLKIEKDYLNRRYDGFYRHLQSYKDYQKIRVKKVQEHKKRRLEHIQQRNKSRDEYRAKKAKIKKEQIDFDAMMAKIERERLKARKVKRDVFIKRRKIMKRLKRTTKKIPEKLDVGLDRMGLKTTN